MNADSEIYILGAGAIGFPLAVYLADAGRKVVAVRIRQHDVAATTINMSVSDSSRHISAAIPTVSLAQINDIDGLIVITSKSYANADLAQTLKNKVKRGPIIILQNGIGVERPFIEAGFTSVYRCVLYATGQSSGPNEFIFRPITASPIGRAHAEDDADGAVLAQCVAALKTESFPFRVELNIQREVWKKAIINAVFNSVCPLLEIDNGIFVRDRAAESLAREIVHECAIVADRLGLNLSETELMEQLLRISQGSSGQQISTLQDINHGRPTEIGSLNLEIARVAAALQPPIAVPRTEFLGKMILAKSALQR